MKQVLVKMPRPIAEKILGVGWEIMEGLTQAETSVLEAALKDALASKPLDERAVAEEFVNQP